MQTQSGLGTNRTGLKMSPKDMKKMLEVTDLTEPTSGGDGAQIADVRAQYIAEADPIGSVPPPTTAKGAAKSTGQALKGRKAHMLIDRLGERLAFERTGTRIYEALITKCEAPQQGPGIVDLDTLRRFCEEEAQHFRLVAECMESLGADPTAQTPSANVAGVESLGLLQVVTDPKTSVGQSLHAILVAELADNAGWEELVMLLEDLGQDEMASRFEQAVEDEREHLNQVREWHETATLQESRLLGAS